MQALTLAAVLGCGLNAGVFFAFSAFVMRALDRLPAAQSLSAMQSINTYAVRPAFMTALFGTAATCLALAASSLLDWGQRPAAFLLAGSALYLSGAVALTIAWHVPLNERLASVDPDGVTADTEWARYVDRWTRWNHVRAGSALAAAAAFALALAG